VIPNPVDITFRAAGLWWRGASLGVRVALLPLEVSTEAARSVCRQLRAEPAEPPVQVPGPTREPARAPTGPSPKQRRRAARREPTRGQAAQQRRSRAEAESAAVTETDALPAPGPEIQVAEPWEGYAAMTAAEVVDRLADVDETTRAAVRLYELAHDERQAVLHATEG
jgi:hypothetical protein